MWPWECNICQSKGALATLICPSCADVQRRVGPVRLGLESGQDCARVAVLLYVQEAVTGAQTADIARALGIHVNTARHWLKYHQERAACHSRMETRGRRRGHWWYLGEKT